VFSLGVFFTKTAERYFGYLIDSIYGYEHTKQSDSKMIVFPARHIELSRDYNEYDDEGDRTFIEDTLFVDTHQVGLLLIDVWDVRNEPNDGYRARTMARTRNKIIPLLDKARKSGIHVFHSPNGSAISKDIQVLESETNLSWLTRFPRKMQTMYFYWLAKSRGINTLLIAGYSTPLCVIERPVGIYTLSRYNGIQMVLVRDATHTWEYNDFEEFTFTRRYIEYLEHRFLSTTTVEEIMINTPGY